MRGYEISGYRSDLWKSKRARERDAVMHFIAVMRRLRHSLQASELEPAPASLALDDQGKPNLGSDQLKQAALISA